MLIFQIYKFKKKINVSDGNWLEQSYLGVTNNSKLLKDHFLSNFIEVSVIYTFESAFV